MFRYAVIAVLLLIISLPLFSRTVIVPGTGDSTKLLEALTQDYSKIDKENQWVAPPSIGSAGGMRLLQKGEVVIARVSGPESNYLKKGFKHYKLGEAPLAFVVHQSVQRVTNLTAKQVTDIYKGKITNWKELGGFDSKIYPVGREPEDFSRKVIEKAIKGFNQVEKLKIAYSVPETAELVSTYPQTLTFMPLAEAPHGTRILKFENLDPKLFLKTKAKYPLTHQIGLIFKDSNNQILQGFFKYLKSKRAEKIIRKMGIRPY